MLDAVISHFVEALLYVYVVPFAVIVAPSLGLSVKLIAILFPIYPFTINLVADRAVPANTEGEPAVVERDPSFCMKYD